jgi:hypothetical protein
MIFAGKTHPRDHGGKESIAEIVHLARTVKEVILVYLSLVFPEKACNSKPGCAFFALDSTPFLPFALPKPSCNPKGRTLLVLRESCGEARATPQKRKRDFVRSSLLDVP